MFNDQKDFADDSSQSLSRLIEEAQKTTERILGQVISKPDNPRLKWLEKQLNNIVLQLQSLMADLEAGICMSDLGFSCNEDFQEMIVSLHGEVTSLKEMIRTCKEVDR